MEEGEEIQSDVKHTSNERSNLSKQLSSPSSRVPHQERAPNIDQLSPWNPKNSLPYFFFSSYMRDPLWKNYSDFFHCVKTAPSHCYKKPLSNTSRPHSLSHAWTGPKEWTGSPPSNNSPPRWALVYPNRAEPTEQQTPNGLQSPQIRLHLCKVAYVPSKGIKPNIVLANALWAINKLK